MEAAEPGWLTAVRAAQAKKAQAITVLDLREITSLTDHFLICTGSNTRQNQAIADEVHLQMKNERGELPLHVEGYDNGEWVLLGDGWRSLTPLTRDGWTMVRIERRSVVDLPRELAVRAAEVTS